MTEPVFFLELILGSIGIVAPNNLTSIHFETILSFISFLASSIAPYFLSASKKSAALCVQLYTGGKTGLQSGSACQEDLQADIGQ